MQAVVVSQVKSPGKLIKQERWCWIERGRERERECFVPCDSQLIIKLTELTQIEVCQTQTLRASERTNERLCKLKRANLSLLCDIQNWIRANFFSCQHTENVCLSFSLGVCSQASFFVWLFNNNNNNNHFAFPFFLSLNWLPTWLLLLWRCGLLKCQASKLAFIVRGHLNTKRQQVEAEREREGASTALGFESLESKQASKQSSYNR